MVSSCSVRWRLLLTFKWNNDPRKLLGGVRLVGGAHPINEARLICQLEFTFYMLSKLSSFGDTFWCVQATIKIIGVALGFVVDVVLNIAVDVAIGIATIVLRLRQPLKEFWEIKMNWFLI